MDLTGNPRAFAAMVWIIALAAMSAYVWKGKERCGEKRKKEGIEFGDVVSD